MITMTLGQYLSLGKVIEDLDLTNVFTRALSNPFVQFSSIDYRQEDDTYWCRPRQGGCFPLKDYEIQVKVNIDNLDFHSDWNVLMEIVQKIESLRFKTSIEVGHCSIDGEDIYFETKEFNVSKIEAVYQSVVLFIVWYNSQSVSSLS